MFPEEEEAILKLPALKGFAGFGIIVEIDVFTRSEMLRLEEFGGISPEGDMDKLDAVEEWNDAKGAKLD